MIKKGKIVSGVFVNTRTTDYLFEENNGDRFYFSGPSGRYQKHFLIREMTQGTFPKVGQTGTLTNAPFTHPESEASYRYTWKPD